MSDVENIKEKIDIVELIREYIPVKPVGVNFQALCPFHNEKTPSLVISPDKQIWHCFGCGRGGDIFSFVMEKEGLDFKEALHFLAAKAGVELKYENSESRSKRNRLLDIIELSGKYYAHILQTEKGKQAKEYLLQRGLTVETITDWQLGYSLDSWHSLYDFLRTRPRTGKKYTEEEIVAAGLIIKRDSIREGRLYYDRFRDRIMFPIWDANNNLVAFTARINPAKEKTEKTGKYINSPQTSIYDKSKILFAFNKAKSTIKEEDLAIVVEGQMDAISCHNYGIFNVVASSGTALTSNQVALIKRFTNNIALAFDMDEAGQNAVDKGIREVLAQGMNVKIITLPQGKDPDECLRENSDEFKKEVANAKPMLDYYYQKISKNLDLEKLENKIVVRDKMFVMISLLNNKADQGYYLKKLSEDLDLSEIDIREEFINFSKKQRKTFNYQKTDTEKIEKKTVLLSREDLLTELFLALIIKFPSLLDYGIENLDLSQVSSNYTEFYKSLIIYYNKQALFSENSFRQVLKEGVELEKNLDRFLLLGEKEFYNHDEEEARLELIKIILELKRFFYQKKIRSLEKELATLEHNDLEDQEKITNVMAELKSATQELKKLM